MKEYKRLQQKLIHLPWKELKSSITTEIFRVRNGCVQLPIFLSRTYRPFVHELICKPYTRYLCFLFKTFNDYAIYLIGKCLANRLTTAFEFLALDILLHPQDWTILHGISIHFQNTPWFILYVSSLSDLGFIAWMIFEMRSFIFPVLHFIRLDHF